MKRKLLALIVSAVLILTALVTVSFADFGDFGGDYDFGDYGGYDNDYDYDWDDDDDWGWDDDDDDFGGFWIWDDDDDDDGYAYSSSDGNRSDDDGSAVLGFIILIIIIFLIVRSKKKKSSGTQRPATVRVNNSATGLRPMSEYSAIDETFSESELCEKLGNLYVRLQNCWTAGDIEELRPYFTDAQFNQYKAQLDRLNEQGLTNVVERINVMSVTARGFTQSGGNDRIVLRLASRITDYTADASGNVVKGSKTAEKFMTYEFDMTRPTGTKTAESTGTTVHNCPNCGAPLDINSTAKCPYCDSIITVDKHDWVISAIRGISQQTVGN